MLHLLNYDAGDFVCSLIMLFNPIKLNNISIFNENQYQNYINTSLAFFDSILNHETNFIFFQVLLTNVTLFLCLLIIQISAIQRSLKTMLQLQNGQIVPFISIIYLTFKKMKCQFREQLMSAQRDYETFCQKLNLRSDISQEQFKNQINL
ncbi:unnamed protein product [Paramecium pentaurelia]|uniref:Transmembrane protein n=1 Tax=Paramecium pentaurelia TaxID=43138 RepID=A0A8S1XFH3_9CILI|nr:unnamed protein product [Paramecium pentaurelia]